VKRPVSTVVLGILNYTGRLLATLTAVVVFLLALGLVIKAHRLLLASQKGLNNPPPILVGNPAAAPAGNPAAHPFWPEFPRSDAGTFQSAVINGIQIMTEEWQCSNPPNDVLAYYRDQMTARGWQDVTEKTYNLQPELREGELAQGQPQDQTYINDYKKNMESKLALRAGQTGFWADRREDLRRRHAFHQGFLYEYGVVGGAASRRCRSSVGCGSG
jgi:hypothetical protein